MKKKRALQMAVMVSMLLSGSWAMADEKEEIRQEVLRRIEIESTKVESLALKKVFGASFYNVTIRIKEGNATTKSKMLLVRKDGKFTDLESTSTTKKMSGLHSLLAKDFKLKTEADAKVFEEAMDKLYPIRTFGSDKKIKAIKKTSAGWVFVRGKFFKNLKGFEVATDAKGVIQSIGYNLKLKE